MQLVLLAGVGAYTVYFESKFRQVKCAIFIWNHVRIQELTVSLREEVPNNYIYCLGAEFTSNGWRVLRVFLVEHYEPKVLIN